MNKQKMFKNIKIFLFCAEAFVILVCGTLLILNINTSKLLNGTHTMATVVDLDEHVISNHNPNLNYDTKTVYYLIYEFYDEDNVKHTGRTRYYYSYVEASNITELEIIYDPNTFESIEASYKPSNTTTFLIVAIVFATIMVGFFYILVSSAQRNEENKGNNELEDLVSK